MSLVRYQRAAAADIPTPPAGRDTLFIDIADGHLKRKDSSGTVFDVEATGTGDVTGPASATDNAIARFDGASGKVIQNSLVVVSDIGDVTLPPGRKVSDSDLLDGSDGAFYLARGNHTGTQAPATIAPQGSGSGLDADLLDGANGAAYLARANHTGTQAPATIAPQGAGSGLDADLLDGLNSTAFAAVLAFGAGSVAATTTDRFLFPGYDTGTAQTSEIFLRVTRNGTLFGFYVQHATGAGNGNTIVYTVRVNGVNTAITASLASTATQASDVANSVAVTAGDRVSIIVTKAASVGTSPSDIYCTIGLRAA